MELNELKIVPQFAAETVCCFTGNRPHKLPWGRNENSIEFRKVKADLEATIRRLSDEGYSLFVCGAALGGDTYFAEAVIEIKKSREVFLECAVPFPAQAENWSEEDRKRYSFIIDKSDFVTVISPHYTSDCMMKRNRYMVDKSSVIVTLDYCAGGGTAATVAYAKKRGLRIIPLRRK